MLTRCPTRAYHLEGGCASGPEPNWSLYSQLSCYTHIQSLTCFLPPCRAVCVQCQSRCFRVLGDSVPNPIRFDEFEPDDFLHGTTQMKIPADSITNDVQGGTLGAKHYFLQQLLCIRLHLCSGPTPLHGCPTSFYLDRSYFSFCVQPCFDAIFDATVSDR